MKTAIIYYSRHHGNTKKLLDAIASKHPVDLIDVTDAPGADLSGFDRIGIASGIYYGAFAKQVIRFAQDCLPDGKPVFFIQTCGAPRRGYFDAIRKVARAKGCREMGTYECLGFDTFGPFKLIGGVAKGHPTEAEIQGAVAFYEGLS